MRHGVILFILIVLVCFSNCKTRKTVHQESTVKREIENITTSIDKSIATKEAGSKITISSNEAIWEHIRRIELDTAGNIRAIQETRRETGRAGMALRNDSSRDISLNDISTTEKNAAATDSTGIHKSELKSDGRPIQGSEWLWVIFAVSTIAAIAIIVFVRKFK